MRLFFPLLSTLSLFSFQGFCSSSIDRDQDNAGGVSIENIESLESLSPITFSYTTNPSVNFTNNPIPVSGPTNIGPILQEKSDHHFSFLVQGPMPDNNINKVIPYMIGAKIQLHEEDDEDEPTAHRWANLESTKFNMTHVVFNHLKADKVYDIQFAFAPLGDIPEDPAVFNDITPISLKTSSLAPKTTTSFILFSCMWTGKWGPFTFGMKDAMQGWRSVRTNIENYQNAGIETDGVLGGGDQVYGDFGNRFAYCQTKREFVNRYRLPYSSDAFKAVTSLIPFQSTPDDHMVSNDSGARSQYNQSTRGLARFDNGLEIAQLIESPEEQNPHTFWRETSVGTVPIFFADVRRERDQKEGSIMGEEQFTALKAFIKNNQQPLPLVVFTVPFSTQDGNGSCTDFPLWQKELMEYVDENDLKFVIFSGDTHVGYTHVFQARDDQETAIGHPILEATVSGFHAHSHGKYSTTKSLIDRRDQKGLLFESTSPVNAAHPTFDKKHTTYKKDLFARMTFNHETATVHVEYFKTKNNQKLMGLSYNSTDGTSQWDDLNTDAHIQ